MADVLLLLFIVFQ